MNGFGPPDEKDTCDCTYSKACSYHAELQQRSREDWERQCELKDIDPDGVIEDDMVELLFLLEGANSLSRNQKDAILKIIFPRK